MKKFSKKLVSLITAAVVTSGFLGTSLPARAAIVPTNTSLQQGLEKLGATSEPVGGKYATNPNGVGKEKTMTIDGAFSDWTEDMIIAQGLANDSPVKFKGDWENCVIDSYSLYSAWDSNNLYIAWQNVNTADVTNGQGGALSEGKLSDLPQVIAIDTGSGKNMTGLVSDGKGIWGMKVNYTTPVDNIFIMHANGTGKPGHFTSDGTGATNYLTNCGDFATEGIEFKSGYGCFPSKLMGIYQIPETPEGVAMLYDNSVSATDLKSIAGKPHNTLEDTFFEMKIPFKALGITKEQFLANGVGIMQIGSRGESGMDCLPHDKSMLDNVFGSYAAEPSNTHEKDDLDIITVPLARAGKGGTITPVPTPTISSLTTDKLSPQQANTAINFSTIASGGTGALTYQYKVNSVVVQDYSSSATLAWKPSVDGNYTIEVNVKDANAKIATKSTTYTIHTDINVTPLTISSFTTGVVSPQPTGNTISLNAISSGGTGTLQTRFTVFDGVNWTIIKGYSTAASVAWTPTKAGNYTVWVDVKDASGKIVTKTLSYTITEPIPTALSISIFTAGVASPQTTGKAITLNAISSGGTGTLQTRFTVFDGVNWTIIKGYSTAASVAWTPTKAGNYTIWVDVKDATGKVVSKSLSYVITQPIPTPLTMSSFTAGVASPQTLGNTITLNTISSGGTGALQTRFTAFDGTKWIFIKDYSTLASASWTPTKAGNYTIWADVKDGTGKVVSKSLAYTIKIISPIVVNSLTSDKISPQKSGTTIKLTTNATSTNTLQYRYWVYDTNGNWIALNSFNTSNYVNWTPSIAGFYVIWVDVKDDKGNISSKYINYLVN